jgi:hypothetical protein
MTGNVREADNHLPIGQNLPVEVIPAGVIGGPVPTGNVEPLNLRRFLG